MSETPAVAVVGVGLAIPGADRPEDLWELLHRPRPFAEPPPDRLEPATLYSPDPAEPDRCYALKQGYHNDFRPHARLLSELDAGRHPDGDLPTLWLRHSLMDATSRVTTRPADRVQLLAAVNVLGNPQLEESLVVDALARAAGKPAMARALRGRFPGARDDTGELLPHRTARRAAAGLLPEHTNILVVETACSSSLSALMLGVRAIQAGDCDIAVCGGVSVLTRLWLVLTARLRTLSPSGELRAFDAAQDGTVFAEGAATVALKSLDRAMADGDSVLGVIHGIAATSDGRGKHLNAPNSIGQARTIRRAMADAGADAQAIDWIITHATGTAVGDRTELIGLRDCTDDGTRWKLSGTKAAVGHTGQAAGTVSVIHALLALRHGTIPAQPRFRVPATPDLLADRFEIPESDQPWPPGRRARLVGINSFGLGGGNVHVVLGDRPAAPRPAADRREPLVMVDWTAVLPGDPGQAAIHEWLATGHRAWPDSFGPEYPRPDPSRLRTPPGALARIDRSHLMVLRCAQDLWQRMGDRCEGLRTKTGVVVGTSDPTRVQQDTSLRAAADHARARLAGTPWVSLVDRAVASLAPPTQDSAGGMLPNFAAARIAALLDFHGPALAVDAADDSGLAALDVAARLLRAGDIDLALVAAVHGHDSGSLPFAEDDRAVAEGAFMVAVTTEAIAAGHRLPVLARWEMVDAAATAPREPGPSHRSADRLIALLRAVSGTGGSDMVAPVEDLASRAVRIGPVARRHTRPITETVGLQWRLTLTDADLALLAEHLVDGRPAIPAALIVEFGVEAAARLAPGLVPVEVVDARFSRFLRARSDGSMPRLWIAAEPRPSGTEILVRLGVQPPRADLPAPDAASMLVRFARAAPDPESVVAPPVSRAVVTDPYRHPASPVRVGSAFGTLIDARIGPEGATARVRVHRDRSPFIVLDALFRTAALAGSENGLVPIAVPTRVGRITLHPPHDGGPEVDLICEGRAPARKLHGLASGRPVATIHDPTMHVLSWFTPPPTG